MENQFQDIQHRGSQQQYQAYQLNNQKQAQRISQQKSLKSLFNKRDSDKRLSKIKNINQKTTGNEKMRKLGKKGCNQKFCDKFGGKNWTISTKLMLGFLTVSLIFSFCVIMLLGVNLSMNMNNMNDEATIILEDFVKTNLLNNISEFQGSIKSILNGYKNSLDILSDIIKTGLKYDTQMYDYDLIKEYPLIGENKMIYSDEIPQEGIVINDDELYSDLSNPPYISLDTSNFLYLNDNGQLLPKSQVQQQQKTQDIYESYDVLNFFLEDWFFERKISYVGQIYSVFIIPQEQNNNNYLMFGYPSGSLHELGIEGYEYQPQSRPWYIKSMENYQKLKNNDGNLKQLGIQIIGYEDFNSNNPVITVTKNILDDDFNVIGIDLFVQKLQTLFSTTNFYETGKLILINSGGHILNHPYNSAKAGTYNIYDSQITQIGQNEWEQIYNQSMNNIDNVLELNGVDGKLYYVVSKEIKTSNSLDSQILIIIVDKDSTHKNIDAMNDEINRLFYNLIIITTIFVVIVQFFITLNFHFIARKLSSPLIKLIKFTDTYLLYNNDKLGNQQNNENQENNKQKKDDIQDFDQIEQEIKGVGSLQYLLDEFQKLIKGMTLERSAKIDMMQGQKKIQFPCEKDNGTNYSEWSESLIKGFDLNNNQQSENFEQNDSMQQHSQHAQKNKLQFTPKQSNTNQKSQFNLIHSEFSEINFGKEDNMPFEEESSSLSEITIEDNQENIIKDGDDDDNDDDEDLNSQENDFDIFYNKNQNNNIKESKIFNDDIGIQQRFQNQQTVDQNLTISRLQEEDIQQSTTLDRAFRKPQLSIIHNNLQQDFYNKEDKKIIFEDIKEVEEDEQDNDNDKIESKLENQQVEVNEDEDDDEEDEQGDNQEKENGEQDIIDHIQKLQLEGNQNQQYEKNSIFKSQQSDSKQSSGFYDNNQQKYSDLDEHKSGRYNIDKLYDDSNLDSIKDDNQSYLQQSGDISAYEDVRDQIRKNMTLKFTSQFLDQKQINIKVNENFDNQ